MIVLGIDTEQCPTLLEWQRAHVPADGRTIRKMLWKEAALQQFHDAQYKISNAFGPAFYDRPGHPEAEGKRQPLVAGTHRSKSIELPVYFWAFRELQVMGRYNFFDWNFSVRADRPLEIDHEGLFKPNLDYCFFQGFGSRWHFPAYEPGIQEFSFSCGYTWQACAVMWQIRRLYAKGKSDA